MGIKMKKKTLAWVAGIAAVIASASVLATLNHTGFISKHFEEKQDASAVYSLGLVDYDIDLSTKKDFISKTYEVSAEDSIYESFTLEAKTFGVENEATITINEYNFLECNYVKELKLTFKESKKVDYFTQMVSVFSYSLDEDGEKIYDTLDISVKVGNKTFTGYDFGLGYQYFLTPNAIDGDFTITIKNTNINYDEPCTLYLSNIAINELI